MISTKRLKLTLYLIKYQALKMNWGVEVHSQTLLTSALDGYEWWASRPSLFTLGNHCSYRRLSRLQGESGRCGEETNFLSLPGIEQEFLGQPTCSLVTELPRMISKGTLINCSKVSYQKSSGPNNEKHVSAKRLPSEAYMKLYGGAKCIKCTRNVDIVFGLHTLLGLYLR
jgi:hypothetical protein